VSIYTIDLRPMQVTINANRVLNAKLVQFNPKDLKHLFGMVTVIMSKLI
jgi:hypothetical protein